MRQEEAGKKEDEGEELQHGREYTPTSQAMKPLDAMVFACVLLLAVSALACGWLAFWNLVGL